MIELSRYEDFFNQIAKDLDLTKTEEDTIIKSYEAVGNYLNNSAELSKYNVKVFPQGSMRLGTIIKPLKKDDYDIDLVCQLTGNSLFPKQIKELVGDALKHSKYYEQLEDEKGRCWTLTYKASPPYHIDILPGKALENERVGATIKKEDGTYKWLFTNPKGFADWFLSLKSNNPVSVFDEDVEEVKKYIQRTKLQRAVQLIKRHRDVYFKDNPDNGPASVIITALTGLAYKGEDTIEEILMNGPIQWLSFIKVKDNGLSIKIPSLPDDDYADKWNENGYQVVLNFLKWHRQLILDLDYLFGRDNFALFTAQAKKMFSESSIDKITNYSPTINRTLLESFGGAKLPSTILSTHPLFRHAKSLPVNSVFMPNANFSVRIECRVYDNDNDATLFNENFIEKFTEFSPILKKGKHLSFKAKIYSPQGYGYHVKWQITNTGYEAANTITAKGNQLRGEFISEKESSKKSYIHTESTSYSGTHFVQCFILRNENIKGVIVEKCVAKSEIITINIGA